MPIFHKFILFFRVLMKSSEKKIGSVKTNYLNILND